MSTINYLKSVQSNDGSLASTGMTVSVPIVMGAALLGAGGVLLLAARRRRQDGQ